MPSPVALDSPPAQDPYHDAGQAHGLAFSVLPPTKPPGSLKNMYKQLARDVPGFVPPTTGYVPRTRVAPALTPPTRDLTPVARAGVLWLNTALTVRAHKAGSHTKKGWEHFTDAVLGAVLAHADGVRRPLVFFAWGLPAQKTCERLRIDEVRGLVFCLRTVR